MRLLLQSTCLKPTYSLKRQLLVAFGTTAAVAIAAVMLTATLTAMSNGETVRSEARKHLALQVEEDLGTSSRYVAEVISKKFDNFGGAVSLIAEATLDRFTGYPDGEGYEADNSTPFRDMDTGNNIYPLKSSRLPLDCKVTRDVDETNYHEHLQEERWEWYKESLSVSTSSAVYRMQGQCDPQVTDPNDHRYFPNCTEANNNITTGGVVVPTSTNYHIASRAGDLNFILKPLYESHEDVKLLGVYFANSGAGAVVSFPGLVSDGTSSYTSIGCDWMAETNEFTGEPIGSEEEIGRCRAEGRTVTGREYNPLERGWCRDQALNPGRTISVGPYEDAYVDDLWLITFGRAVFDRITGSFIGCTLADVSIARIAEIINSVKVGRTSNVVLVRWDDKGTIAASSSWNPGESSSSSLITEADIGIDGETYNEMKSLVDFETRWEPRNVRAAFKKVFKREGKYLSIYPIPVPPDTYVEKYLPEFMVIMSVDVSEVYGEIAEMDDAIDHDVRCLIEEILIVGFVGLFVVLLVIWMVSRVLTKPLRWMEHVSGQIVNDVGGAVMHLKENATVRCSPRTEVTVLVSEFKKMVFGFGGDGAARIAKPDFSEVKNDFESVDAFKCAYPLCFLEENGNKAAGVQYGYTAGKTKVIPVSPECKEGSRQSSSSARMSPESMEIRRYSQATIRNLGSNAANKASGKLPSSDPSTKMRVCSSRLFWWILLSIIIPLFVTMAAIGLHVTTDIAQATEDWLGQVESVAVSLARIGISTTTSLRASYAQEVMKQPIRDLHLYTRVAGWLLFGGLERSEGFAEMISAADECKMYRPGSCPFFQDKTRTPCDCAWNDMHGYNCTKFQNSTRHLQKRFYNGMSEDADSITGDRKSTSFPDVAVSPNTTEWWHDVQDLPGSAAGSNASGYMSTYDRVRVLSAGSIVEIPLYNYHVGACLGGNPQKHLASYIGLEADGMMIGYAGCDYGPAMFSYFMSSENNRASEIQPELCPRDKYGFDCRCRDWYAKGKKKGEALDGGSGIHITPPYLFAGKEVTATTATYPLIDPVTKTHVGQAALDFLPHSIVTALENTFIGSKGFPILITPEADNLGADVVVAPKFSLGEEVSRIADKVVPFDDEGSENREFFESRILAEMKRGKVGESCFTRHVCETEEEEELFIAYEPVSVKTFRPIDHSDFSRGINVSETLVYSLGIVMPTVELSRHFDMINDDTDESTTILFILVVVTSVVVAVVTYCVTVSITTPIITLLGIVQDINNKTIADDFPVMKGGSREVSEVYNSFAKMHKVVRFSNWSFFSGNLTKAYEVLRDALTLFRNLQNRKAVGIANNNMGNTLMAIYREMCAGGDELRFGMNKMDVYNAARKHFDEAVRCGTEDYTSASVNGEYSPEKAAFAKQLANRHFNRALFLLVTGNDQCAAEGSQALGQQDLRTVKRLSEEAREYWARRELRLDFRALQFDDILRRVRGMIFLVRDHGLKDDWGIGALIEEGQEELLLAWEDPKSPLFDSMGRFGRRQQLEDVRIQYELSLHDVAKGAEIALRIFTDDEYILLSAAVSAMSALIQFMEGAAEISPIFSRSLIKSMKRDLSMLEGTASGSKDVVFCVEHSESIGVETSARASENFRMVYEKHCSNQDMVGFVHFNQDVSCELTHSLSKKGENLEQHHAMLNHEPCSCAMARPGANMYTALSDVADMIVRDGENIGNCWIVAFADGKYIDTPHGALESTRRKFYDLRAKGFVINLLIIGFCVPETVANDCKYFCTLSRESLYIDVHGGLEEMDEAFDTVVSIMRAGEFTPKSYNIMETF